MTYTIKINQTGPQAQGIIDMLKALAKDYDPIHIHVEKENKTAKFNLKPVELIKSKRFNASELKAVRKLTEENVELFRLKWDEYFNN